MKRRQFLRALGITAAAAPVVSNANLRLPEVEAPPCHAWPELEGVETGVAALRSKSGREYRGLTIRQVTWGDNLVECTVCGDSYLAKGPTEFKLENLHLIPQEAVRDPLIIMPVTFWEGRKCPIYVGQNGREWEVAPKKVVDPNRWITSQEWELWIP